MTQDINNSAEQTAESGSLGKTDQAGGKQPAGVKAHASDLARKVGEIEKELAHVSATLQEEAKTVAFDAVDLVKHPGRYAELEGSLAEGMAGESLGEMLGAGVGTLAGPEGTVIGAEMGGLVGEVFGARQGGKIAKKFLHQPGTKHPLKEDLQKEESAKEDLQKEESAKLGGHTGKIIGGMIGDVLFDDAGSEIGEAVGDKIGKLAGNLAYDHVAKMLIKDNNELLSDDVSKANTDEPSAFTPKNT